MINILRQNICFHHKAVVVSLFLFQFFSLPLAFAEKIDYWDKQRRGANNFNIRGTNNNIHNTEEWFKAASETGIQWVRFSWGKKRGFLMGDSSNYRGLIKEDLEQLKQAVKYAAKYNIKIVLVPISLPGAVFRQLRGGKNDMRLWTDKKYWHMVGEMWQDLAEQFKDNPTVVAYNIFNEPYPEFKSGSMEQETIGDASRFIQWSQKYKATARDLQAFYHLVIKSIRAVDTKTPIMLESGWYSQPNTFVHWLPVQDDKVLYQFHMYEPYKFTSGSNFRKKHNLSYPGKIPFGDEKDGQSLMWNKSTMEKYFKPFYEWVEKHNIPSNRIVAGEFGCYRKNKGCDLYMGDLLHILNEKKYHWAFYTFRGDWDGFNYELGTKGLGWQYWKDVEAKKKPIVPYKGRENNKLWMVIQNGLKQGKH